MNENEKLFLEEHAAYIEENRKEKKKIVYAYAFNWHGFTYENEKDDFGFCADVKFHTFEFEEDYIGGVTQYLSARIDLQEEKLVLEIDKNLLFESVEVINFDIDKGNFYKRFTVEEGEELIQEYCRQAKNNELPHIELTGSAVAFRYEDE